MPQPSRRDVVRVAAWSVPAVAVALAAPAAAASDVDLGALRLTADCGVVFLTLPSITLTASSTEIPTGTLVTIVIHRALDPIFGPSTLFSGPLEDGEGGFVFTTTAPIPAGTLQSITVSDTNDPSHEQAIATVSLPAGYTATGAKTTASFRNDPALPTACAVES